MKIEIEKQKQVESFWNEKPCDSDRSSRSSETQEYFFDIEKDRYNLQTHIKEVLSWIEWDGKKVLEIGTGVGTDARSIISFGAIYTGINVDQGSTDLTMKALAAFELSGTVKKINATTLPFPDQSFDVIYSFGVLHHIPNIKAAVSEIFRVLKPGGEILVMVYNRYSINYYVEIMFLRKLFQRLLILPGAVTFLAALGFPKVKMERHKELYRTIGKMSDEEWLSRNTDGPDNPYSKVYGQAEIEEVLHQFQIHRNEVRFFDYRHWGISGRLLPRFVVNTLGKRWGWHRVVYASKLTGTA
jgi:ubiquinone/menaquinone biosynthesis C-methylase UbiE